MNNITNPYVATLVEMGYDRQDCETVAAAGVPATYPRVIHGRTFETEADYKDCLLYTSPSPRDVEESRMPSSA